MEHVAGKRGPYALKPGEGWTYRLGIDFCVKAGEAGNENGAAVMEYRTRKGEEPDDHVHETEDEMFHVLEGSLEFQCAGETFSVESGGFIFLPAGMKHGYTVGNEEDVRLLVITAPVRPSAPNGWGGFIADLELGQGELVAEPQQPPCP